MTLRIIVIFFLCAGLSLPSCRLGFSQEQTVAQMAYEEGLRLEEAGNLLGAQREMKKAIQLDPANPEYHFRLANIHAMLHDRLFSQGIEDRAADELENAARELGQVIMLNPANVPALYNLGVVYKRQRRFEQSREQFRKVLDLEPNSASAMMQIGASYEEQGFFDEAKDAYLKANTMDYKNPEILGALEDLEEHKRQDHARQLAEREQMMMNRRSDIFSSTYSSQAATAPSSSTDGNQSIQQAIPYLSAMLIQQFLKFRKNASQQSED